MNCMTAITLMQIKTKDAYNNAVNNAKQLINQSDANQAQLDPAEINKVTQRVNTTKMI